MAKNKLRIQLEGSRYYDIQVYNNQKVIHINKLREKAVVDLEANKRALHELSLAGFALYSHLMHNKPEWLEALSKKRLLEITPLTSKHYENAVAELIEKQYLCAEKNSDFKDYYEFYELPKSDFLKKTKKEQSEKEA